MVKCLEYILNIDRECVKNTISKLFVPPADGWGSEQYFYLYRQKTGGIGIIMECKKQDL